MPCSYAEAAHPDVFFTSELTAALEASERSRKDQAAVEVAVADEGRNVVAKTSRGSVFVHSHVDLSRPRDLSFGPHNSILVAFVSNSEVHFVTANEVLRLAQLSERFSRRVLMGAYRNAVLFSDVQFLSDKLITGSAFVAMKDLALFNATDVRPWVYDRLFQESDRDWVAAVLHANAVLGPFPNVCAWADGMGGSCAPAPMAHEVRVQLPYVDHDPGVREGALDTEERYEFVFVSNEVTTEVFQTLIGKDWTYIGPRIYNEPDKHLDGGYHLVFRRVRRA